MGMIYSFMNEKGGVGKSTVTMTIAKELAKKKKVLIVDFDGQVTSITNYIGVIKNSVTRTIKTIIEDDLDYRKAIIKVSDNLEIIASNDEVGYMGHGATDEILRVVSDKMRAIAEDYDYVLVDLPPSAPVIHQLGLISVDKLVLIMSAEYASVDAVEGVQTLVQKLNENYPDIANIEIAGVVVNRVDQKAQSTDVLKYMDENAIAMDLHMYKNIIKEGAHLGGIVTIGHSSIVEIEPNTHTACGFRGLVQEIFGLYDEIVDPYSMIAKDKTVVIDHIKMKGRAGKASRVLAGKRFVIFEQMDEDTYYNKAKWIQKAFVENGVSHSFKDKIKTYFGITKDGTPYIVHEAANNEEVEQ